MNSIECSCYYYCMYYYFIAINNSYLPSPSPSPESAEVVVPIRIEEEVTNISSSISRIAISEDDSDSEDALIEAGTSNLPTTVSQEKISEVESKPPAAIGNDNETHSMGGMQSTKKPTKKATPTSMPSKDSTLQLNTVFELQRLLEKALSDSSGSAVNAFFDALEERASAAALPSSSLVPSPVKSKKVSSTIGGGSKKASKVSSSSNSTNSNRLSQLQRLFGPLMEPDLLLLFLQAVSSCPIVFLTAYHSKSFADDRSEVESTSS